MPWLYWNGLRTSATPKQPAPPNESLTRLVNDRRPATRGFSFFCLLACVWVKSQKLTLFPASLFGPSPPSPSCLHPASCSPQPQPAFRVFPTLDLVSFRP